MRTQTEKDPGFNLICSNLKDLLLSDEHKTSQGLSLARSIITGLQSNPSSAWPVEEKGTLTPCPTQHPMSCLISVLRELREPQPSSETLQCCGNFWAMVPKFASHEILLQGSWTPFGTGAGRGAVIPGLEADFLLNSADRGNEGH